MVDDIDFKKAMAGVRRLKNKSAFPHVSKQHPDSFLRAQIKQRANQSNDLMDDDSKPVSTISDTGGRSNEVGDNTLFFLRDGLQKKVLRDLKKGVRYPVDETLDLHGQTRAQAQQEIEQVLRFHRAARYSCLLIIHGKGLHSPEGATLKTFTAEFLKTRAAVKAYCSARPRHGGTGALYVLLDRQA